MLEGRWSWNRQKSVNSNKNRRLLLGIIVRSQLWTTGTIKAQTGPVILDWSSLWREMETSCWSNTLIKHTDSDNDIIVIPSVWRHINLHGVTRNRGFSNVFSFKFVLRCWCWSFLFSLVYFHELNLLQGLCEMTVGDFILRGKCYVMQSYNPEMYYYNFNCYICCVCELIQE